MCDYRSDCNGLVMYQGYDGDQLQYKCDRCGDSHVVQAVLLEPYKAEVEEDDNG